MVVYPDETFYTHVNARDVKDIVEEHILEGQRVERLLYRDLSNDVTVEKWRDIGFYSKQQRVLLSNSGIIDPENIDHYLAREGYQALHKVLKGMTPEQVIEVVTHSGVRGRGGGGFPAGVKWGLARKTQRWPKYVICNADEGDPGAFMDRSVLEGDPHSVIEGMIIAGYAIGAQAGYIYCRAEYPLAIRRLEIALVQARELGVLGESILGSDFSFDIRVKEGAGAFVCGEETALMASIQGERGQPWPRPPYPAVSGLWNQPSNVNNVKSYAYVPRIIRKGAEWFNSLGTEGSPGTAVFALTGQVNATGLRYSSRSKAQSGTNRRASGRLFARGVSGYPGRFRFAAGRWCRDGFRRDDRRRRDNLHGRIRQVLFEVRLRRELRQVPALPHW
jgi:hypothetical protein